MRVKHTDTRDITVAEITWVCAVPQGMGYVKQLMCYLVLVLRHKFDALELKVDMSIEDLVDIYGDGKDDNEAEKAQRAQNVAENALKEAVQAQKVTRLVAFYRAIDFETQTCHCDGCRWNGNG